MRAITGTRTYWYVYWKEKGRTRSNYIAKELNAPGCEPLPCYG